MDLHPINSQNNIKSSQWQQPKIKTESEALNLLGKPRCGSSAPNPSAISYFYRRSCNNKNLELFGQCKIHEAVGTSTINQNQELFVVHIQSAL